MSTAIHIGLGVGAAIFLCCRALLAFPLGRSIAAVSNMQRSRPLDLSALLGDAPLQLRRLAGSGDAQALQLVKILSAAACERCFSHRHRTWQFYLQPARAAALESPSSMRSAGSCAAVAPGQYICARGGRHGPRVFTVAAACPAARPAARGSRLDDRASCGQALRSTWRRARTS